jgi:N-acetylmuramoyl-L-alanine amidase
MDLTILEWILTYLGVATPGFALAAYQYRKRQHRQRFDWAIDNGHGSLQAGKRSPVLDDGRQLLEWEFNRRIARPLVARLTARGVSAWLVVPEDEVGAFLNPRIDRIEARQSSLPKVSMSIHANAAKPNLPGGWTTAKGTEVFYYTGSTKGRALAERAQHFLIKHLGRRDRGVKHNRWMRMLQARCVYSILLEIAFMNNPVEVELLLDDDFCGRTVDALEAFVLDVEQNGL